MTPPLTRYRMRLIDGEIGTPVVDGYIQSDVDAAWAARDETLETLRRAIDPRDALHGDTKALAALAEAHRSDSEDRDTQAGALETLRRDNEELTRQVKNLMMQAHDALVELKDRAGALERLRAALQRIADEDDSCQCDHADDECCAKLKGPSAFCGHCIAEIALHGVGEAQAWQLIETAPKDGTRVLVLFNGEPHVARYAPVWAPGNLHWIVNHPRWRSEDMQMVSEIEPNEFQVLAGYKGPTHWMPLPSAPERS